MASDRRPAQAYELVTRAQRMMATEVSVQLAVEPERIAEARAAVAECFAWFAEIEQRLSRFQPTSELCALNRSAGSWFAASETLYTAVFMAIQEAHASDGLFNPGLLHRLEALGYDRDFSLLSREPAAAHAPAQTSPQTSPVDLWKGVIFDTARRRIRLPAGAALDLGGIAKGWAADVAMERYCLPFPGALINVGGDMRLRGGPQPGRSWTIGLRDPRDPAEAQSNPNMAPDVTPGASAEEIWNRATVTFSRGALATSGAARRWWHANGERYHHLLDPRTGQPLPLWTSDDAGSDVDRRGWEPLIASVTALAPTGAQAEVATKVALARGYARALAEVEEAWARWGAVGPHGACDAGVALIFTLSDGRVIYSANLAAWLDAWGTHAAPLPMILNTQGAQPLTLGTLG
ncbi:MAG TPA: FAD:protein FMN transferase [Ktedonobacterales bacterium]|nr:FAD:protein FMN transferase [Ktedonobacterales bacterium]